MMPKIYIKNPVILNLSEVEVEPLADDEVFVQIEENPAYYISSYGRFYSKCHKKILRPQMYGRIHTGKQYFCYKIKTEDGYRNYKAHRLVARVFCPNNDPKRKIHVHHLNKSNRDNYYKNLLYVAPDEHKLLESGLKLYLYNMKNGTFKRFMSFKRLCNYTGANYVRIYKAVRYREPDFTFFNGLDGYEVRGEEFNGFPLYVGVEQI